jgi:hypothetical protein
VLRDENSAPSFADKVVQIREASTESPRYVGSMTVEQLRHVRNLMLLCDSHRAHIGENKTVYSIQTLLRWKKQCEADSRQALQRLREVTPDGLRKIVAGGLEAHDAKLERVLRGLKERDTDAAFLMRGLIDELTEAYTWQRRKMPDPAMIAEFSSSVSRLNKMSGMLNAFIEAVRSAKDLQRKQ